MSQFYDCNSCKFLNIPEHLGTIPDTNFSREISL